MIKLFYSISNTCFVCGNQGNYERDCWYRRDEFVQDYTMRARGRGRGFGRGQNYTDYYNFQNTQPQLYDQHQPYAQL